MLRNYCTLKPNKLKYKFSFCKANNKLDINYIELVVILATRNTYIYLRHT